MLGVLQNASVHGSVPRPLPQFWFVCSRVCAHMLCFCVCVHVLTCVSVCVCALQQHCASLECMQQCACLKCQNPH